MSEETPGGVAAPSDPVQPTQQNDSLFGENPVASADNTFEKIKRATKGVFEKHGVTFRRGGGRPRKDGMPNKLDIPINAPPTALPLGTTPDLAPATPGLDPALVKKCCNAVIKAFKGFLDKTLFNKARRKYPDDPKFCSQIIVDTTITNEEADAFSELAEVCLRKYGVGTEYAPEIGLGAIVIGIGVRYAVAFKSLEPEKKTDPQIQLFESK
jgi:hypothetical protein